MTHRTERFSIRTARRSPLRFACLLVAVGILGCGPGYEKGVNKDLDKPVHTDKQPDKK
jgi:hypothetical protein